MAVDLVDQLFAESFVTSGADVDCHRADALAGLLDVHGHGIALCSLGGHLAVYRRVMCIDVRQV